MKEERYALWINHVKLTQNKWINVALGTKDTLDATAKNYYHRGYNTKVLKEGRKP